jgi:hypothetical protein
LTKPLKTAATVGQQDIIEKKSSAPSLFLFIPLKLSQAIQKKRWSGAIWIDKAFKTAATFGQQDIIEKRSSAPSLFLFIPLKLTRAIQKNRWSGAIWIDKAFKNCCYCWSARYYWKEELCSAPSLFLFYTFEAFAGDSKK